MTISPINTGSGNESEKPPVIAPPVLTPQVHPVRPRAQLGAGFLRLLKQSLAAGVVLLLVLFFSSKLIEYFNPPEKSIVALDAACKRHDRKTVELYVDAPALSESMKTFVRDMFEWQESHKATQDSDDGIEGIVGELAKPFGYKLVYAVADRFLAPENIINMLSGQSSSRTMKVSLSGVAEDAADKLMPLGGKDAQVYTPAIKFGLGVLSEVLVDAAESNANAQNNSQPAAFSEKDVKITKVYESSNRYLVIYKALAIGSPAIGLVYERHGVKVWKWSGIRLLPPTAVP